VNSHGGCVDCETTPARFIFGSFFHCSSVSTMT
jgi:hypothetical protein